MAATDWIAARPVAHRGLHDVKARIVENTLPAVEAAIEAGYAVEIDVQAAAGLEPVVFHDTALERLTVEVGPVSARTPAELARIPLRGTRARIPALASLLGMVAGRAPLLVEIKTDWTGMPEFCARIAAVLKPYAGPVAVMSFDPLAVAAIRRIAPDLPRGIVAESFRTWAPPGVTAAQRFSLRHLLHLGRTRPHFIAYGVDDLPAMVPLALKTLAGMPLLAWTVQTETQRQRAGQWASQIIFEGFRA